MAQEDLEHRELARAQLDRAAVDVRPAGAQVERDVARAQHGLLGGPLVAQPHAHAREQLLEAERLGDVVVGAVLEPGDLVLDLVAGGEDDDRHAAGPARASSRRTAGRRARAGRGRG